MCIIGKGGNVDLEERKECTLEMLLAFYFYFYFYFSERIISL